MDSAGGGINFAFMTGQKNRVGGDAMIQEILYDCFCALSALSAAGLAIALSYLPF